MSCNILNHDWSQYYPVRSASDTIQLKVCRNCGKFKEAGFSFNLFAYIHPTELYEILKLEGLKVNDGEGLDLKKRR